MKTMKTLKSKKGFTLIEVIVVLAVIAIMAAVLTPMIIGYVSDARKSAAQSDVKIIATAVLAFNKDTNDWPLWAASSPRSAAAYDVLISTDGEDPVTGGTSISGAGNIDGQLVGNTPGYPKPTDTIKRSRWIGPYLETVKQDPWGTKYVIDVKGLQSANLSGANMSMPAFVISAGPNKLLETAFGQAGPSINIGNDDIVFRIK